jgi:hypothetical protein
MQLPVRWQVEVAAMLAHLGFITLPTEVVEKYCSGREMSGDEREMLVRLPKVTDQLLGHIPRLEVVRNILGSYSKPFNANDYTQPDADAQLAARGAQILKVALEFDAMVAAGSAVDVAIGALQARAAQYDQKIVVALADGQLAGEQRTQIIEVSAVGLAPGMVLADDVKLLNGTLLVTAGIEVTIALVERIRNYKPKSLKEPLRVVIQRRA